MKWLLNKILNKYATPVLREPGYIKYEIIYTKQVLDAYNNHMKEDYLLIYLRFLLLKKRREFLKVWKKNR